MSKLLQMVFRFFKYLIQSKSRFSIHSPFVFDFLNDVIRSKKDYYCFSLIQKTKQQLHYNHTKINITELGAGSHVNNNKQKKISTIMRNASKPHGVSKILFEIVNYFPIQNSIEIGTSLGISTLYIAKTDSLFGDFSYYCLRYCFKYIDNMIRQGSAHQNDFQRQ